MIKFTAIVLALGAALLLSIGCGTARRSEPILGFVPAGDAKFADGRKVFAEHCHTCHPGGDAGLAPALNNKPLPAGLIKFQIRQGLGAMPAFGQHRLSDEEVHAVAEYVVALRRAR